MADITVVEHKDGSRTIKASPGVDFYAREGGMTGAELLEKLKACAKDDPESAHMNADQALLDYIGDPDIRAAFEAIGKWYAWPPAPLTAPTTRGGANL